MPVAAGKLTEVILIRPDGTTLDINDWSPYTGLGSYTTDIVGLHDIPTQEPQISTGYQRGGVFSGGRWQPRQFEIDVVIEAGKLDAGPNRNAAHNAARDQLIIFLGQRGQPVTLRTQYLGTAGYWDIDCTFQQGQYQPGTNLYKITFLAPDPTLKHSVVQSTVVSLDSTHIEQTVTITVTPGNQPTYPVLTIQPTAQKTARWSYSRNYTVTNPQNIRLPAYVMGIPFDFAWHLANGRIKADGSDIRVYVNGVLRDFWFGDFPNSTGKIWTKVDLDASATVDLSILYGAPAAVAWPLATLGPSFDKTVSDNTAWHFIGGFMDTPGFPTTWENQWNVHAAQSQGLAPVTTHQPAPWSQAFTGPLLNVAGGYIPFAVQVQGYAGLAFHHLCGISAVTHHGFTRMDPALEKLVLRGLQSDGSLVDVWSAPAASTLAALTDYGTVTTAFTAPVGAVAFAIRSMSVHNGTATVLAGADSVTITINNPPTVAGAASGTGNETQIYMLEFTLENNTSGDQLTITGPVLWNGSAWYPVILDLENQLVTMAGGNMSYAFQQQGVIREVWFRLLPGANSVRVRDEAVNGLDVTFDWQCRRV